MAVLRDYIAGYSNKFGISAYASFNTEVLRMTKVMDAERGEHRGWNVATRTRSAHNDTEQSELFDFVIVANGVFNSPKTIFSSVGDIEAFRNDGGLTLHSSEWRSDLSAFEDKSGLKCAVVGAGKSSYDVAFNCLGEARHVFRAPVTIVKRRAKWHIPLHIPLGSQRVRIPFEWFIYSKFAARTFAPSYFRATFIGIM